MKEYESPELKILAITIPDLITTSTSEPTTVPSGVPASDSIMGEWA